MKLFPKRIVINFSAIQIDGKGRISNIERCSFGEHLIRQSVVYSRQLCGVFAMVSFGCPGEKDNCLVLFSDDRRERGGVRVAKALPYFKKCARRTN